MKVVVNRCYGGFSLSPRAISELAKLDGKTAYFFKYSGYNPTTYEAISLEDATGQTFGITAFDSPDLPTDENDYWKNHNLNSRSDARDDPKLVQVVEMLGSEVASGSLAELEVVEIPDGTDWVIDEYDGMEHVEEAHRSW
jgi:hypothetical protein